jgi:ubiquinone/menaquinone biosynthesis C-methylase UbiE
MKLSPHASANRSHWNESSDDYQARHGDQLARKPQAWGVWALPEDELCILGDVAGKDVLEFGCGAAQWSIALSQRGARCTGLDISEQQLQYARANMESAGVDFPLVHGSAEDVPLQDCSFDIVFCDHGAMTFADPLLTVPEAARLLRPGGLLAFSASTPFHFVCWDDESDSVSRTLRHNYFEKRRADNGASVCFSLPYGEWIGLFRRNKFTIESLVELKPPEGAETSYAGFVSREWATSWPAEHIWRVTAAT